MREEKKIVLALYDTNSAKCSLHKHSKNLNQSYIG